MISVDYGDVTFFRIAVTGCGKWAKMGVVRRLMLALAVAGGAWGATVEGVARNLATGAAVAGVEVELRGGGNTWKVTTGISGGFVFGDLKPGTYEVYWKARNYFASQRPRHPLQLASEQDRKEVVAELVPPAKLSGRVMDAEGKPVPGSTVELLTVGGAGTTLASVNAEGKYLYEGVQPGYYRLRARAGKFKTVSWDETGARPPRPVEGEARRWAVSYYPGVTELAQSQRLAIGAGADLTGYDIEMRAVRAHRLEGQVLDARGDPARAQVVLMGMEDFVPSAERTTGADGRFVFEGVVEGEWRVAATAPRGSREGAAFVRVTVSRREERPLELRLALPFGLRGTVTRERPPTEGAPLKATAILLRPEDVAPEYRVLEFHDRAGEVRLPNVHGGRYRIVPLGYVPGAYVESVRLGEEEVLDRVVQLDAGSPAIRVTYRGDAPVVRGVVEKGAGMLVVLMPEAPALRTGQYVRTAECDEAGSFAVHSLRPGVYRAWAFDRYVEGLLLDEEFQRLLPAGVTVEAKAGETKRLELGKSAWPGVVQ